MMRNVVAESRPVLISSKNSAAHYAMSVRHPTDGNLCLADVVSCKSSLSDVAFSASLDIAIGTNRVIAEKHTSLWADHRLPQGHPLPLPPGDAALHCIAHKRVLAHLRTHQETSAARLLPKGRHSLIKTGTARASNPWLCAFQILCCCHTGLVLQPVSRRLASSPSRRRTYSVTMLCRLPTRLLALMKA